MFQAKTSYHIHVNITLEVTKEAVKLSKKSNFHSNKAFLAQK